MNNKTELKNDMIDLKRSNDATNKITKKEMDDTIRAINDKIKKIEEIIKNSKNGEKPPVPEPLNKPRNYANTLTSGPSLGPLFNPSAPSQGTNHSSRAQKYSYIC